jgi:hypothetical protein
LGKLASYRSLGTKIGLRLSKSTLANEIIVLNDVSEDIEEYYNHIVPRFLTCGDLYSVTNHSSSEEGASLLVPEPEPVKKEEEDFEWDHTELSQTYGLDNRDLNQNV